MIPCSGEGQFGRNGPDELPCCDGLVRLDEAYPDGNGGCQPEENAYICTRCGDGMCGLGENTCNCPADCMEAAVCVPEGEQLMNFEQQCCPNTFPVECLIMGANDRCEACAELTQICLACGDGVCSDNENRCTCPIDCEN